MHLKVPFDFFDFFLWSDAAASEISGWMGTKFAVRTMAKKRERSHNLATKPRLDGGAARGYTSRARFATRARRARKRRSAATTPMT